MRIHLLQHVPFEGPAAIGDWAAARGHELGVTRLFDGEPLPALGDFDFLIVLGGPMNIYEDDRYPWLSGERDFLRQTIGEGKIVLGICLGAQLLADALGARVYSGGKREIGWSPISLTDAAQDDLFIGYAPSFPVFHWHGDTFDLPPGTVHLARSRIFEQQAFSWGDRVVGLQFHLEATSDSVQALIENCADEIVPSPTVQSADQMLDAGREFPGIHRALYGLLDRLAARHGKPTIRPELSQTAPLADGNGPAKSDSKTARYTLQSSSPLPTESPSVNSTANSPESSAPMQRPPHTSQSEYPKPDPERDAQRQPRQYITFSYYKLDPAWRHLSAEEQQKGRDEWIAVVREFQGSGTVVVPYSCVGIRADHDILLWRIDYQLERLQQMQAALSRTILGRYLLPSLSFLSMSKRSTYVDKINPEHEEERTVIAPGRGKYIFVYPFVKSREWYLLHPQTRQGIMDEHIQVGVKYQSVKLNTTYSFGLDDQDFVVAFEGDHPEDFLDLVMELRETDGSKYTVRDTPIITGIKGTLEEIVDTLG